nr:hypothetical protein [Marinitoga sp. 1154]
MKESIYIFSSGQLKRKDNSIVFITSDNKKKIYTNRKFKRNHNFWGS